jgi:hypothetical protein
MALIRTKHWATREYDAHLRSIAGKPFAWGAHDCCLFAANAIQAFTGTDIAADFRGKYTDKVSAFKAIQTITGGTTVADAAAWCANKYGLVEHKLPLMAKRGDLVVMRQNAPDVVDQLIVGIVHLNGSSLVTVGEGGAVRLSILSVVRAWQV